MENPYQSGISQPKYGVYNWDSHAVNCHLFKDARIRFPIYDRTVTAMVEDLYARGLDRKVLLVVTGEFGRTPYSQADKSKNPEKAGRDHHNTGFSMFLAGGGAEGGLMYGNTDEVGMYAVENRMHVHDLHATILHLMGIDHTRLTYRYSGRDFRLTDVHGRVVRDVIT